MSICHNTLGIGIFPVDLGTAPDIYRFPMVHMVKTHFLLENLSISEPSWSKL